MNNKSKTARHKYINNNTSEMFAEYPDVMTIEDLQRALGVGRSTAYRLIRSNRIRCIRIGKSIRIPKQLLVDYVLQSCYNKPVAMGNLSCQNKEDYI